MINPFSKINQFQLEKHVKKWGVLQLKKFSKYYSWYGNEALEMASHIIKELDGWNDLSLENWLNNNDINWVKKCSKPHKKNASL